MSALPIIGGVLSAFGDIYQGIAAKAAADYNADMYRRNAGITRQQAMFAATQQARENYLRLGDMQAQIGASGARGASGGGSYLDVLADTAAQGEIQKQQILYGGEVKARNLEAGATLQTYQGKAARMGSYLSAGGDLLSMGGGGRVSGPSSLGSVDWGSGGYGLNT